MYNFEEVSVPITSRRQLHKGVFLRDPQGYNHRIFRDGNDLWLVPLGEEQAGLPRQPLDGDRLIRDQWSIYRFIRKQQTTRKGVKRMDKPSKRQQPEALRNSKIRITSSYLRGRGKASVTLTKQELEHLGDLIRAGRVITKDYRDVSKNLRQAMNKLGVDTRGL